MMLGTFLKNFSHVATSQGYFLKWQLPKYILAAAHDPPPLVLAAARGSLAHPGKMQLSLKLNNENSNEIPANLNTTLLVLFLLRS